MHIRDWDLITTPDPVEIAATRWMQSFFDEHYENSVYVTKKQIRDAYLERAIELEQHPVYRFQVECWWLLNWWRLYLRFWHQDLNNAKKRIAEFRGGVWIGNKDRRSAFIGWELSIPTPFWHLKLEVGGEDELTFSITFGIVALWLKFTDIIPRHWFRKWLGDDWFNYAWETGIAFHYGIFWVDWLYREHGWKENSGIHWSFNVVDFLLGQERHEKEILSVFRGSTAFDGRRGLHRKR